MAKRCKENAITDDAVASFQRSLKNYMLHLNINQTEFANKLGVSASYVNQWINCITPMTRIQMLACKFIMGTEVFG